MNRNNVAAILAIALSAVNGTATAQFCRTDSPETASTLHFTPHGDGTVTDNRTGLMWKRCEEGRVWDGSSCADPPTGSYSWQDALLWAESHSFASHDDWRVPNLKELLSITELSCFEPSKNLSVFPFPGYANYWSASPYAFDEEQAWYVSFGIGQDDVQAKTAGAYLLLVRGGQ